MGHLPPAKHNRNLDLVAFFHKTQGVFQLDVKIMLLDIGTKLYFFYSDDLLLFLGFLFPFLLFISIFAEIHDAAHRRFRLRRHLHKIKVLFLRQAQSIPRLHDAELLARRAGHAHFPDVDFLIDSQTILTDKNTPPPKIN